MDHAPDRRYASLYAACDIAAIPHRAFAHGDNGDSAPYAFKGIHRYADDDIHSQVSGDAYSYAHADPYLNSWVVAHSARRRARARLCSLLAGTRLSAHGI